MLRLSQTSTSLNSSILLKDFNAVNIYSRLIHRSVKVVKSMHQENECKRSSIGNACLMPEFTKVWSAASIALIKLTADTLVYEVLQLRF